MLRLLQRIRECEDILPKEARLDEEATHDALAAALLHDLGHGPFSHLFEDVLPHARRHEDWTVDAIRSPSTDVHRALEGFSSGMAERVAGLIGGEYRLPYLVRAVSGTLDVDRADYLLRDSQMTGVRYGLYDLDWLLQALTFGQVGDEWVLAIEGRKGLPPIESFFLGRHFMYQQVYHHKGTRAAEAVIRAIFARVAELIRDGSPPDAVPPALEPAVWGEAISLGDYIDLDDARMLTSFAEWQEAKDPTLREIARRLRTRQLPKTVPLPEGSPELWEAIRAKAAEVVTGCGLRADLEVWLDVPSDVPYSEPVDDSPEGLWVVLRHRPIQRLGDASFLLGELRNKRLERPRLIFPTALREEVIGAIEGMMR